MTPGARFLPASRSAEKTWCIERYARHHHRGEREVEVAVRENDAETFGKAVEPAKQRRRSVWAVVVTGIAFAVLFLASMFTLSRIPGPRASDAALETFYASDQRRLVVLTGLYLLPFAAVAFLWFMAVLRDWESNSVRRLSRVLSNVQLLSGIAFITLILASAGATVVTAFANEFSGVQVEPILARQFPCTAARSSTCSRCGWRRSSSPRRPGSCALRGCSRSGSWW